MCCYNLLNGTSWGEKNHFSLYVMRGEMVFLPAWSYFQHSDFTIFSPKKCQITVVKEFIKIKLSKATSDREMHQLVLRKILTLEHYNFTIFPKKTCQIKAVKNRVHSKDNNYHS